MGNTVLRVSISTSCFRARFWLSPRISPSLHFRLTQLLYANALKLCYLLLSTSGPVWPPAVSQRPHIDIHMYTTRHRDPDSRPSTLCFSLEYFLSLSLWKNTTITATTAISLRWRRFRLTGLLACGPIQASWCPSVFAESEPPNSRASKAREREAAGRESS